MPIKLIALLALLSTPSFLSAQILGGSYEIQLPDGSPVVDGAIALMDITDGPSGPVGDVSIDLLDGDPPQPVPQERVQFTQLGLTPNYYWVNERGTEGILTWNSTDQRWESTVLTGPNAGHVTILDPL